MQEANKPAEENCAPAQKHRLFLNADFTIIAIAAVALDVYFMVYATIFLS